MNIIIFKNHVAYDDHDDTINAVIRKRDGRSKRSSDISRRPVHTSPLHHVARETSAIRFPNRSK